MRKLLIKVMCILLVAGGLVVWSRTGPAVLAVSTAVGLDDSAGYLASRMGDPRALDVVEASSAGMLRVPIPWDKVERSPGAFSWSYQDGQGNVEYPQFFSRLERRGIEPVAVLAGGPAYLSHLYPQQPVYQDQLLEAWESYLRAVVGRLGDQVDIWQIGERINDPQSWGGMVFPGQADAESPPDPVLYSEMLRRAYAIIKSADAGDTVILGSLVFGGNCAFHPSAYLQALQDLDAWYAFDAAGIALPELDHPLEQARLDECGYTIAESSGYNAADSLRFISDLAGSKPLWVTGLGFSADLLAAESARRGTLPQVVEADLLTRASAMLLAYGQADQVFWSYHPPAGQPGIIAMQNLANLNTALVNSNMQEGAVPPQDGFETLRFRGSGKLTLLAWRVNGGDEAVPLAIQGLEGYGVRAWSADAASLKNKDGIPLQVDAGGSAALLVSERPVIISGRPSDIKQSATQIVTDQVSMAQTGLKTRMDAWLEVQKAKAADNVGSWVAKQQQSLLDMLSASFQQWLRSSLGLAKQ